MENARASVNRNTSRVLAEVVSTGNDFEWYPTTDEIIVTIKSDLSKEFDCKYSLLDCGAGDGRVLKALSGGEKYAIEKSKPLLNLLDPDIFVVGTEFKEQTLLDKKVDVIFSNPPYSEFEAWSEKIIREASAGLIYLVIPERWVRSDSIQQAIEDRGGRVKVLGDFDFLNAERKARARVEVIKIDIGYKHGRYSGRASSSATNPFELWFKENFKIDAKENERSASFEGFSQEEINDKVASNLVKGGDVVQTLAELYQHELDELIETFKKLESIDGALLRELNVNKQGVCEALRLRVNHLKDRYWSELFDRFEKVTSRLTKNSRQKLLDTLTENTSVDFTVSNAYAVVVWVLKNANQFFDDQLIQCVETMTERANVSNYASNKKVFGDEDWRYCKRPQGLERYKLEYRIILEGVGGICDAYFLHDKGPNNLSKRAHSFIQDLLTIATNLGFDCTNYETSASYEWESNKRYTFHCKNQRTGKEGVLCEVKAFKNGNLHLYCSQDFILRLNVEFGRLKGWLKDTREVSEELDVSLEEAIGCFNTNLKLNDASCLQLGVNS